MWIIEMRHIANGELDWKYNVKDSELEEALVVSS
jgi:hypothetical protein